MVTRLEAEIAAEDALRMQCFKILPAWLDSREWADRIIARHKKEVRQTLQYVDPILREMFR
jgi:hypothetical protein